VLRPEDDLNQAVYNHTARELLSDDAAAAANPTEGLKFPPYVRAPVGVMFWPIIWAGALAIAALAGDLIHQPAKEERV